MRSFPPSPTPQVKGVKHWKKKEKRKTTKHYKAGSQTPQKFFVCCFVAIIVKR